MVDIFTVAEDTHIVGVEPIINFYFQRVLLEPAKTGVPDDAYSGVRGRDDETACFPAFHKNVDF